METIQMVGFLRKETGKKGAKALRRDSKVPCVLYGGEENVHFYVDAFLFRKLVYTSEVYKVELDIEGKVYHAILQDIQEHPVSEVLNHADFLEVVEKEVNMDVPVRFKGSSPGIVKGGKLVPKLRAVKIKAKIDNIPSHVYVDISHLDLGQSVRVKEIEQGNYKILNNGQVTIASVAIPRALKSAEAQKEDS